MLIFSLVAQGVSLLVAMLFSARWAIKAKGFFEGVIEGSLLLYGLAIAWIFLFSGDCSNVTEYFYPVSRRC